MTYDLKTFLREYISSIHEGDAALFLGAGFSTAAGYVDWRGLLDDCATALGLNIAQEHDLVALAQYYLNENADGRDSLNKILENKFGSLATITENHKLMAALPITTVWTTNFDCLIEAAFKDYHRNVDVKLCDTDIPRALKGRDVVLYKMHGDVSRPGEAVLCKQDYERYSWTHPVFQISLRNDLVTKTFLFLGFSFSDPNLDYTLGHLRSVLGGGNRPHYAVFRRVRERLRPADAKAEEARLRYERIKQDLKIKDLERYNIHTILVEHYSEVTSILRALERGYSRRSVFVSGSIHDAGEFGEERLRDLCTQLGERLMLEEYRLISGLGLNCGADVVKGALVQLYKAKRTNVDRYVWLRPFPRNLPPEMEPDFNEKYRHDTILKCAFAIFVAGRSRNHEESRGVLEEFRIASKMGKICIPIGATGFAARRIWHDLKPVIADHYRGQVGQALFAKLNDPELDNTNLLDAVFEILELVCNAENVAIAASGTRDPRAEVSPLLPLTPPVPVPALN